jgi:TRAP-type C4-dicarboxylate transport system permease small subunit
VLSALWRWLDFGLKVIMAIFLFVMMVLTSADVIGRYVLNAPISGAFEIVQYLMAVVVFAALPVTTASDGHLSVSLVPSTMRGPIGRAHRIIIRLVSAIALFVIAWRMIAQAQILDGSQQVSGYLQLPLAPIAAVMAVFAVLALLIMLVKLIAAISGSDNEPRETTAFDQGYE